MARRPLQQRMWEMGLRFYTPILRLDAEGGEVHDLEELLKGMIASRAIRAPHSHGIDVIQIHDEVGFAGMAKPDEAHK